MNAIVLDWLAEIHPDLPAAIGHAMAYCVEDGSADEWQVLVDPDLRAAAQAFYPLATALASKHTNLID